MPCWLLHKERKVPLRIHGSVQQVRSLGRRFECNRSLYGTTAFGLNDKDSDER